MTHSIDSFLIRHGFEEGEVRSVKHRSFLYGAIITLGVLALTFLSLSANAWV